MRAEYEKLIATAKENGNLRLAMIIEIIGSTGMRISELASVTVEAVGTGKISITEIGSRKICPCEVLVFKGRPPKVPAWTGSGLHKTRHISRIKRKDRRHHKARKGQQGRDFPFFLLIPLIPLLAAAAFPVLWAKSQ